MRCDLRRIDARWLILGTGFTILFFGGGSRFVLGLMLKTMSEDLDWSRSALSLVVTCFMVVTALALPLVGVAVDRYNLRSILTLASVLCGLGIGLVGLVTSPWHVFLLYGLVYAIGNAGTSVTFVGVMISRWFDKKRSTFVSIVIAGSLLGQLFIVGVLASSLTILGWRMSFIVLGAVIILVLVPLVLVTVRDNPGSKALQGSPGFGGLGLSNTAIAKSRPMWLLVLVFSICGIQDFFVVTHVVAFALDQDVDAVLSGSLLAFMGLTGLLGVIIAGAMTDAYGAKVPTALCFLMRLIIFICILLFDGTVGIAFFALLYGFTFLITGPTMISFALTIFGSAKMGFVNGYVGGIHTIMGGLGALMGGIIFDTYGSYSMAFVIMVVLSLVAIFGTFLIPEKGYEVGIIRRRERKIAADT